MAYVEETVLALVKTRLNRVPSDTTLDGLLKARIQAVDAELASTGILLEADSMEDTVLLMDMAVWQYQNRDSQDGMPQWLRLQRRERFLQQIHRGGNADASG